LGQAPLRLINDSMPFLIGYVDKDEKFQYANKGYSDWCDVSLNEVMGSCARDIIGAEAFGQVLGYVQQALAGTQCSYEYHMERRGKTVFACSTLVPERAPDQKILGFFSFSQDITEQKVMQAALMQSQKIESLGQLTGGLPRILITYLL
jgi:PAS domain S-box-containing protein